ncbi:MAG: hypothetical protein KF779_09090 [Hyphomonadaceae bacterium]|nr:hypothetical protein [Hyphomonadaceae bacterium]
MQRSPVRVSHALQALAPHHANEIAGLLHFPHQRFFGLSSQRIHLLGLSLIGLDIVEIDIESFAAKRWADVIKPLFDPGPIGLGGVLDKMALPMWSPEDYRRLWGLIGCSRALGYLLHSDVLTPQRIAILHELPPILRHDSIVRHLHRVSEAIVLARAFADPKKARALLSKAKQSKTRKSLLGKAANIVTKTRKFTTAPDVNHPDIECIRTADELRQTALWFKNCLRSYVERASRGELAFYRYTGEEPAVIMLSANEAGAYAIEQMRGMNNADLGANTKEIIRTAFAKLDVADRREAAYRTALDTCLLSLSWAVIDAAQEIDDCCDTFLGQFDECQNAGATCRRK